MQGQSQDPFQRLLDHQERQFEGFDLQIQKNKNPEWVEEIISDTVEGKIFLFDHSFDNYEDNIYLSGYLKTENSQRKVRLQLTDVPIDIYVAINYSFVEVSQQMQSFILNLEEFKKESWIVLSKCTPVTKRLFKGYQQELPVGQKFTHLHYQFQTFQEYKKFRVILLNVNKSHLSQLKNEKRENSYNSMFYNLLKCKEVKSMIFKLSEDDTTNNYIYKILRQNCIKLSDWSQIKISNFRQIINPKDYRFKRFYGTCSLNDITPIENYVVPCPLTLLTWDIETCSETGMFTKDTTNPQNPIICIGGSFAKLSGKEVTKFCTTFVPFNTEIDIKMHFVPSELKMLLRFAQIVAYYDPDIIVGFNDSQFDWPYMVGRLQMFNAVNRFLTTMYPEMQHINGKANMSSPGKVFQKRKITLLGGHTIESVLPKILGNICIDLRTILIKTQNLEKSSLNHYLEHNKLDLKLSISFKDMNTGHRLYLNGKSSDYDKEWQKIMADVMNYCAYDADALRLLIIKLNVLQEHLEIASLTYCPLRDTFDKKNGYKVRNIVAQFSFQRGFVVPMSYDVSDTRISDINIMETFEKFPGALVVEPLRGVNFTPVIALDFASLYPSIIRAHNLSPENITLDFQTKLPPGFTQEKISVCMSKDDLQEIVVGYVITNPKEDGIYPQILQDLFEKRRLVKDEMGKLKVSQTKDNEEQVQFKIKLLDSKQTALKLIMNTFYGEAGNSKSPFFDLIVSGGTTTLGQQYIRKVHKIVESKDCELVYGDTDSVYIRPRQVHYKIDANTDYKSLIRQSIAIAKSINADINKEIGKNNRNILKMEFEESLLPSIFAGKKKYFGVKYATVQDVEQDKPSIFIKGIDFIKSQYPLFVKNAGSRLLDSICDILMQAIQQKIKTGQLTQIFQDSSRKSNGEQLLEICNKSACEFINNLAQLDASEYKCLVSQKKISGKESGEMALFRQRFVSNSKLLSLMMQIQTLNKKKTIVHSLLQDLDQFQAQNVYQVDIEDMERNGIQVPQKGDCVEIIYVDNGANKKSDKMYPFDYVQFKDLQIDYTEYQKMFNTTLKRITVCCFEGDSEQEQLQRAKQHVQKYLTLSDMLSELTSYIRYINSIVKTSITEQVSNANKQFLKKKQPQLQELKQYLESQEQVLKHISNFYINICIIIADYSNILELLCNQSQENQVQQMIREAYDWLIQPGNIDAFKHYVVISQQVLSAKLCIGTKSQELCKMSRDKLVDFLKSKF